MYECLDGQSCLEEHSLQAFMPNWHYTPLLNSLPVNSGNLVC